MRLKLQIVNIFLLTLFFGFFTAKSALAADFTLSGSVKDNAGTAIIGATVAVNDANSDNTTTDNAGNYSLSIPEGTYNVQITPPYGSNFSSAVAFSQNISTNTTLNFVLTPAGTITLSGHVYDALGNPITNQAVKIQAGSNQLSATTDASGNYFLQASAGTYLLNVTNTSNRNNSFSQSIPQFYNLSVSSYAITQDMLLNFILPLKSVSVHIQDPSGNAVSGAVVTASSPNGLANNNGLSIGGNITNASGQSQYNLTLPHFCFKS